MAFTSTPRGARLVRRLACHRLDAWGHPYESGVNTTVTLFVAELAANAVTTAAYRAGTSTCGCDSLKPRSSYG